MAIRNIVKIGDNILRKKAKEVKSFDNNLFVILDDMAESMYYFKGMGLAGPQVGILKQIVVMEVNNCFFEMINPKIIYEEGSNIDEEACLSIPNKKGLVKRPQKITVRFNDRLGNNMEITGENIFARCVCHEIDHLNGILYTDKMEKEILED